ncbi:hypothetical protein [Kitasatospora griseola]|uniref:hypothetical protein n=1 Tax=Kitasatospora griseola TaxID=2064 RepID=UPI0037F48292
MLAPALALLVHHSISADSFPAMRAVPGMAGMVHGTAGPTGDSIPDGRLAHSPADRPCTAGAHCVGTDVRGPVLTAPAADPALVAAASDPRAGGPRDGRHPAGPSPPDLPVLSVLRIWPRVNGCHRRPSGSAVAAAEARWATPARARTP